MKTLLINTSDVGGAANACINLHKGLMKIKYDSTLMILDKPGRNIENCIQFNLLRAERSKIKKGISLLKKIFKFTEVQTEYESYKNILQHRDLGLEGYSILNSQYDITQSELYNQSTIINLHWVSWFLDFSSFFQKNDKPVVWTLHDMNAFTGGEHYSEWYAGIDNNGFPIKRVVTEIEQSIYRQNIENKVKVLEKTKDLTVVCPSKWLADEARKSEVFKNFQISTIPYGIDTEVFKQRNKKFSRELLGLPDDKIVILFVADSIVKYRKGFEFIYRAFEQINDDKLILVSIGCKSSKNPNPNFIEFGYIKDELLLSVFYSAADVFVIPSLMDNLPNTVLESISCGTPVIGFNIGGIPDMVEDGINGFICDEISVKSLSKTIRRFIKDRIIFDSQGIRRNTVNKYNLINQANSYLNLYKNISSN